MPARLKVIIDFDGTLTAEERQAEALAERSLDTLADEFYLAPREVLTDTYLDTRARLLASPHLYWWEVNGLVASYCDEGAFILNTTTLQVMLRDDPHYAASIAAAFRKAEYDPIIDCTNYLFHRHTAELLPEFRPGAAGVLNALSQDPEREPVVLTNSLGDKVTRFLATLNLRAAPAVLGDTRQYAMDPGWQQRFTHSTLGEVHSWPATDSHVIDLRRPAYHGALVSAMADGSRLAVVADTLSLPGALPLMMGIPFFLLHTPYTPTWSLQAVEGHSYGHVLAALSDLPAALDAI